MILIKNHNKVRENLKNMINFKELAENTNQSARNNRITSFSYGIVQNKPVEDCNSTEERVNQIDPSPEISSPTSTIMTISYGKMM